MNKILFFSVLFAFVAGCGGSSSGGSSDPGVNTSSSESIEIEQVEGFSDRKCGTARYKLKYHRKDGKTLDVTSNKLDSAWSSSNPDVAEFVGSPDPFHKNLLVKSEGKTTITARFRTMSDSIEMDIKPGIAIESLELIAETDNYPVCYPIKPKVYATYTDDTEPVNISNCATLKSLDSDDDDGIDVKIFPDGTVMATEAGVTTNFQASVDDVVSPPQSVIITESEFTGLTVLPSEKTLKPGWQVPLTATAKYANRSDKNISRYIDWKSSSSSVVDIDFNFWAKDPVVAVANPDNSGIAEITASCGELSGTANITSDPSQNVLELLVKEADWAVLNRLFGD